MAEIIIRKCVDDLDNTKEDAETVFFAFDGMNYKIDLADANHARLAAALEEFVEHATALGRHNPHAVPAGRGRGAKQAGHSAGGGTGSPEQNAAIREWAKSKGIEVSDRGRIKQDVIDRYQAEAGHRGQTQDIREKAEAAAKASMDKAAENLAAAETAKGDKLDEGLAALNEAESEKTSGSVPAQGRGGRGRRGAKANA